MSQFDIIVKNVKVIDGTGNPGYEADVGILEGNIEFIGNIEDRASTIIDGKGLVLCPGFIDRHGHSDLQVFHDSSVYNKLEQGITTEISGFCGLTLAPVSREYFDHLKKYTGFLTNGLNMPENWSELSTFGRYMDEVDKLKLGPNMAFYVGQGTIRVAVMGFENRKATAEELEKMKDLVRDAMENGALGLSTGLIYAPGVFTPKEEIIELCKVVKEYGGSYASHIRNESNDLVNAVKEAIDIGRQAEVQVLISHHKIAGKNNWGKSKETLKLVDEANKEGLDVSLDQYPYTAGSSLLCITIPPEFHEGGLGKLLERIKDKETRKKIKREILNPDRKWENMILNCGFDGILVLTKAMPEAHGKTVAEYAEETGMDPIDAIFDILIKTDGTAAAAYFLMDEGDIERIMKYPYTMVGTDGALVIPGMEAHPRAIGTYPRILGRYVRERGVLTLEEAIKKMTSLPASKAKLKTKGLVKEGFDADLVIFNPDTIIDRADYKNPELKNEGIEYVIVNGKIAVKNNKYTGETAGKVIRVNR